MRIIICSLFILSIGCASAQTRLSTPVVILPKADHSAAGVVQLLDNTGANPFPISESSPHLVTFGSSQHLVWDDTNGVLGITTNGSSTNGMIITSAAGNNAGIYFLDGATYKWGLQKNATSLDFTLFDAVTSAFVMDIASGGTMKLEPATNVDLLPGSGLTAATGEVAITQAGGGQAFSVSAVGALAATINNANGAALNLIGGGSGTSRTTLIVSNTGSAPGINVTGGSGGHSIDIAGGDIAPTTDGTTNVGESNLEFDFLYGKILGLGAMTMQPWSGTPNGFVAAPIGSLTADISGSAPWYKSTSGGTSGWVQLGSGGAGVTSLSPGTLTGAVTLAGGTGILVQHLSGSTITVSPNTATTCSSAFTDCMTTDTSQAVTGTKTFSSNLLFSADNTYNVGSANDNAAEVFTHLVFTPQVDICASTAVPFPNCWNITEVGNGIGSDYTLNFTTPGSVTVVTMDGTNRSLYPPNASTNLGTSSNYWTNGFISTLFLNSALASFGSPVPNGYFTNISIGSGAVIIGSSGFSSNVVPASNNTYNLGASGVNWTNGYITNIFAGGISTGTIEATSLYIAPGAVNGVSCSGLPSVSFASIGGIVTHC